MVLVTVSGFLCEVFHQQLRIGPLKMVTSSGYRGCGCDNAVVTLKYGTTSSTNSSLVASEAFIK